MVRPLVSDDVARLTRPERALDLSTGAGPSHGHRQPHHGRRGGEFEADTPLLEAGLTSNLARLLRAVLTAELPGITPPVTQ
eukprot:15480249-Alexandrium_andersonii.AAC.1